ncbi:MAG: hypothetical protein P8N50_09390, partial [Actinomycetota bacterium]|nr:hypothetical protein [Actinomycetota bacterium]
YLLGAMRSTGVPVEISERFATETAELVGASPPDRWPDTWGNSVDLTAVLPHRDALMERLNQLIDEIEASQT